VAVSREGGAAEVGDDEGPGMLDELSVYYA
jgi:hypothetical protein